MGISFDNYSNTAPRVFSDDLGTADMFALFGPGCMSVGHDRSHLCSEWPGAQVDERPDRWHGRRALRRHGGHQPAPL